MLSGRRLDLLDPSPLDIEIEDIAHGLARVARWNGQTKGDHAFSVAQHCVLVEQIFAHCNDRPSKQLRLVALLHDAPEYVIGLPPKASDETEILIKQADKMAAYLEATQLAGFAIPEAEKFFGRPKGLSGDNKFHALETLPTNDAATLYLSAFKRLNS
jgi:uncharacterized protein